MVHTNDGQSAARAHRPSSSGGLCRSLKTAAAVLVVAAVAGGGSSAILSASSSASLSFMAMAAAADGAPAGDNHNQHQQSADEAKAMESARSEVAKAGAEAHARAHAAAERERHGLPPHHNPHHPHHHHHPHDHHHHHHHHHAAEEEERHRRHEAEAARLHAEHAQRIAVAKRRAEMDRLAQQQRQNAEQQQQQQQAQGHQQQQQHQQQGHNYQQYSRQQPGHAQQPPIVANTPPPQEVAPEESPRLFAPLPRALPDAHSAAAAALASSFNPDPFRKVRLRIPLEITSVHGCAEGSHPHRRATSQCLLDGSVKLTIRGRGFQAALGPTVRGASAWLVEASKAGNVTKPISTAAVSAGNSGSGGGDGDEAAPVPLLRIPCGAFALSSQLPDLVAYCTLPSLSATDADVTAAAAVPASEASEAAAAKVERARLLARLFGKGRGRHSLFSLQLFSGDGAQSAILRDSVSFSKKAVMAPTIPKSLRAPSAEAAEPNAGGATDAAKKDDADDNNVDNEEEEDDDEDEDEEGAAEVLDEALQAAVKSGNWKALGIGGLDKQFSELFRRAFSTRAAKSSALVSAMGIQHIKGVILHGPPGTGKTLAARMLAKLLKATAVTIVNGPELMSKYIGDSEKNIRELFAPAMAEHKKLKDKAGLHVIVFDEVDAILRPRGANGEEGSSKALYDGVTTQLLSYMDGIDSAPNVLLIGLTNRLDALDKALLRPGRFEVQIRLHLPDREGREEVLWVHTQKLRDHRYLASDVSLSGIAEDTISFSGADLAGTVRSAISYALERHAKVHQLKAEAEKEGEGVASSSSAASEGGAAEADAETCGGSGGLLGAFASGGKPCKGGSGSSNKKTKASGDDDRDDLIRETFGLGEEDGEGSDGKSTPNPLAFRVTAADFRRAVKEILAARSSGSGLSAYMGRGVVPYSRAVGATLRNIDRMAAALLKTKSGKGAGAARGGLAGAPRVARYAITGPRGSGKTAVAALAARNARYASSFVISPEALIGLSPAEKIKKITDIFDMAVHTPSAVVLIDDCDTIIESIGGKGNLAIVVALRSLIHRDLSRVAASEDSNDNRLLIITTSTGEEVFQHLGLYQFDGHAMLADLSRGAAANVLHSYHVFGPAVPSSAASSVSLGRSKALSVEAARNLPPRIPIKRLMFFIDQVRAQNDIGLYASSSSSLVPIGDLTEHKLFPSLWSDDSAETEAALQSAAEALGKSPEAAARIAKKSLEDIFDPFAPDAADAKAKAADNKEQAPPAAAAAQYATVQQFHSVLAQFHSFYSNTNGNFMAEDLTPA